MKTTTTPRTEDRNPFLKLALFAAGSLVLWSVCVQPAQAQVPLYTRRPVQKFNTSNYAGVNINLSTVPPPTSVEAAAASFDARAAAAIYRQGSDQDPRGFSQVSSHAKFAYGDYFDDPVNSAIYRATAINYLATNNIDLVGTGGNGDFGLAYLIPLYYRYFKEMDPVVRDHILTAVFNVRGALGGHEEENIAEGSPQYKAGLPDWTFQFFSIPETENHLLQIETERYLINQLLYQRSHEDQYDNLRNGRKTLHGDCQYGACDNVCTTEWLLMTLAGKVRRDFKEYNARPYQDEDMAPLLALCTYAYDDRVRLAARMVLDYISAKVAVSSNGLRRAPPFRRRAVEDSPAKPDRFWGPTMANGFLGSPLIFGYLPVSFIDNTYEFDPQTTWYCMLAGNTEMFNLPDNPGGNMQVPWTYKDSMVQAGLCDYRIPPSILDLFVNGSHRRFYQRFHHNADTGDFADELYAGSPSYLITAGGHPTTYCYTPSVGGFSGAVIIDILYSVGIFFPLALVIAAEVPNWADNLFDPQDLGAMMPTTFMPTRSGFTLADTIQFGTFSIHDDPLGGSSHMGVAPDFACGGPIYIPDALASDSHTVHNGNWTFINRSNSAPVQPGFSGQPGYYLAIYTVADPLQAPPNNRYGILEAYDTWLHPGSSTAIPFDRFQHDVMTANPGVFFSSSLGGDIVIPGQTYAYRTHAGQIIQFTISPDDIVFTTEVPTLDERRNDFTSGDILRSAGQDTGYVTISNPSLGTTIVLDYRDPHNLVRTDESGAQQRDGQEVWVDFNSGNYIGKPEVGDFGDPFWSLRHAVYGAPPDGNPVPTGGIIELQPGTSSEPLPLPIGRPMTIRAPGGPATIRVGP